MALPLALISCQAVRFQAELLSRSASPINSKTRSGLGQNRLTGAESFDIIEARDDMSTTFAQEEIWNQKTKGSFTTYPWGTLRSPERPSARGSPHKVVRDSTAPPSHGLDWSCYPLSIFDSHLAMSSSLEAILESDLTPGRNQVTTDRHASTGNIPEGIMEEYLVTTIRTMAGVQYIFITTARVCLKSSCDRHTSIPRNGQAIEDIDGIRSAQRLGFVCDEGETDEEGKVHFTDFDGTHRSYDPQGCPVSILERGSRAIVKIYLDEKWTLFRESDLTDLPFEEARSRAKTLFREAVISMIAAFGS
ncbi:hypothetical protein TREMEDRAFT_65452 [Tremella mesenterica DSM 1558]|uniref:uncharacterized protein n=1 Tax=Tremella mesenterica (strain ATCC 24925 / CBS 8224 / DSM 1558 / NBRC 9311 / NRRL Y-6157 / RJB 2259-6 / UBC 559-6) TaxID=578456 RepID=UPI00032D3EED|nr:uncharacterized protein TREMEDRAFT_65452 [Tremella mesenterica DSM 1558]EIW66585.1 hypothetical protein TREMEDRAFT_65452 [Tremella mesenterica DSM 1558]